VAAPPCTHSLRLTPPPSLPPVLADRVTGAAILCRAAHVGAAWLERAGAAAEASALLRGLLGGPHLRAKRGAWWERLAINAERAGRPGEALEIAEAALADGAVVGGARLGLQRRVLRLGRPPRRWGAPSFDRGAALWEPPVTTIQGAPQASIVGVKSRFALAPTAAAAVNGEAVAAPPPPPTTVSVEGLALHHYAAAGGWAGAHGEGGPWARLLHLLLAAPVWGAAPPGALRVPGLAHPADLGCAPHFYEARAAALDAALAGIAAEDPPSLAARVVAAARGRGAAAAPRGLTVADLADVAACAGGPRVAAILSLIVRAGGTASAFPDLTLWRVARRRGDGLAAAGDARLVEVKGPRDRLSDGQRWVLAELARAGVACEVLKVVEPKKKKGGGGVA
jgi:Fanconi-associated nuclease 1